MKGEVNHAEGGLILQGDMQWVQWVAITDEETVRNGLNTLEFKRLLHVVFFRLLIYADALIASVFLLS